MTSLFDVTRGQKFLIAGTVVLNLLIFVMTAWLWVLGLMPLYMVLVSIAGFLFFVGRYRAIQRFPSAELRDNEITVYGWFGRTTRIDLNAPFEFYSTGYLIVMRQGRSTGVVARYVVGKARFDELGDLLLTSRGNIEQ